MSNRFDAELVRKDFHKTGAAILPSFFSADELAPIIAAVDEHWKQSDKNAVVHKDFERFETYPMSWNPVTEKHPAFLSLLNHPDLDAATRAVLGSDYVQEVDLVMYTAKGMGQAWHQDCPPENLKKFTVNRLIYVRDVDPAAGALVYVPGSHLMGRIPAGGNQDPIAGEMHVTPKAGTLAFLNSLCFHRVTANQLDTPRVSINFRVRPPGVEAGYDKVAAFRGGEYDFAKQKALPVVPKD
jgi:ectoine hydroxylase